MRLKIYSVFSIAAYSRVNGEEGVYEAHVGYNIIAQVNDGTYCTDYLYTGGSDLPALFDYDGIKAAVDSIESKGSINAEDYWEALESRCSNLPDYVTNPHRKEYN